MPQFDPPEDHHAVVVNGGAVAAAFMSAEASAADLADDLLPSDDLLAEQAYLVARGVRPLSLIGHCPANPILLLRVATRIEVAGCPGTVPFVIDHGDKTASFGYAGAPWALDLYQWANDPALVPQEQRHRINGLLLGYSVPAIARHDDETSGRRFPRVTASRE